MKIIIKLIKNIKNFNLNIKTNIMLISYDLYYNKYGNYDNYNKYNTYSIKNSLYLGINNFIFYVIKLLKFIKNHNEDKTTLILNSLDIY